MLSHEGQQGITKGIPIHEKASCCFRRCICGTDQVLLNADGTRNYWSKYNTEEQNAKARYPKLCYTSAEKNNYQMNDYWLMDGSYFRVKNINIAYTLPRKIVERIGMKDMRVYVNADDPFCFDH